MPQLASLLNPGAALDDVYRASLGFQCWNFHPFLAGVNASSLTSQTIFSMLVPGQADAPITGVGVLVTTAAVGTQPTGVFVGLSTPKTMLAISANLAALSVSTDSTANFTATGYKFLPLNLSQLTFPLPTTGPYYVHLLINGTYSGTQPQFGRAGPAVSATQPPGAFIPGGTAGTGQTALPAVGAAVAIVATSGLNLFAGLY